MASGEVSFSKEQMVEVSEKESLPMFAVLGDVVVVVVLVVSMLTVLTSNSGRRVARLGSS